MTTFDKREQGFEAKFVHDEELMFKATARSNKLLGLWAASQLGLSGEERPFAVVGFGYPVKSREPERRPAGDWLARGKRKPFDEVVDLR